MDMDGARNAKLEVLVHELGFEEVARQATLPPAGASVVFGGSVLRPEAGNAARRLGDFDPRALVAVGIGAEPEQPRDHRLLLLCQSRAALQSPVVDRALRRARGEARAVYTGPVRIGPMGTGSGGAWSPPRRRPLTIGVSVAHRSVTAGTLGCFVRHAERGLCILSNNHVLAATNQARPGDAILQPGRADGGSDPADRCATLAAFVPIALDGATPNLLDAAIANVTVEEVDLQRLVDPATGADLGSLGGEIAHDTELDAAVFKVGRTTGFTEGRVVAVEVDNLRVNMSRSSFQRTALFNGQTVIGSPDRRFSAGGDSGSVIWDGRRAPVALLFAGSESRASIAGTSYMGLTYANPLDVVTAALGVVVAAERAAERGSGR